jgi:4-hydroxy-3-methylbut-2-enyl diphosphate reductase IspH
VGIANQTTMYKQETAAIAKLFERTMMQKFGPQEVNNHFMSLDTICDATQVPPPRPPPPAPARPLPPLSHSPL